MSDDDDKPPPLPPTPGHMGELPMWHVQERLDRLETHKRDVEKTLVEHALQLKQHKESLNAGNEKFSGLENKIVPRWSYLAVVLGAVTTLIWSASRYPDPQKFEDLKNEVLQMKFENVGARRDVEDLKKAFGNVEAKIDRLLSARP